MEKIEKLQPRAFTRFCMTIGAVPSSYLEGMTIERQLLWFCSYLEKEVIPAVNQAGGAVEELQALYTQLLEYVNNYFENLDVQEEINNKLDEMAESGELADIIAQYLTSRALLVYNSVADLKLADNLVDGSLVATFGYYSTGDKGAAKYKVRPVLNTDVIDDVLIVGLADPTLVAELVMPSIIYPEIFACYGDGTHDDTEAMQKAIDYAIQYGLELNADKSYLISDTLYLETHTFYKNLNFNGTITFTPEAIDSILFSIYGSYSNYYFANLISSEDKGIAIYCWADDYTVFAHNDIKLGTLSGFATGILFDSDKNNEITGIQYNKVHEGYISATTGIKFNVGSRHGWINQNYFNNIRINGYDGIYIDNPVQDISCQNNIFTDIGLEVCTHYTIYEKNGTTNKYRDLRIEESTNAVAYFDHPTYSEFNSSYGAIFSRITKTNGGTLILRDRLYFSDADPTNFSFDYAIMFPDGNIYFNSNNQKFRNVEFSVYDDNIDLRNTFTHNFPEDVMIKYSNYNSGNNTITINDPINYRGQFFIRIAAFTGGDLKVYAPDGTTQIGKTINQIGLYTFIKNKQNEWQVGKQDLML